MFVVNPRRFELMSEALHTTALKVILSASSDLAFQSVSLSENSFTMLRGASGSGKSTLMHALAGLQPIAKGHIQVGNNIITSRQVPKDWRRVSIGFIPQRPFFWPSLTVKQNLSLSAWCKESRELGLDWVDKLGLTPKLNQNAHSLSLGEQQRLSAVRAFANHAPVLLADEPIASLDQRNAELLLDSLKTYQAESGCAVLFASHDPQWKSYANQVIEL